ncbi:MAG: NRDE family protein [Bacteroidota bacterium]
MCLILFAYQLHPKYSLILAANRDEFYDRPTARIHRWNQAPIHAGKDLKAGGTWMGVNLDSRWAALTNYRSGKDLLTSAPSRGDLVIDYLMGQESALEYAQKLEAKGNAYNGYNILLAEKGTLYYHSNRKNSAEQLAAGIHGLSNAFLDTSWPKVDKGKAALERIVYQEGEPHIEDLFRLLKDQTLAEDDQLPDTGIPYEWEKSLSAMHIKMEGYGTRVSTVLLMDYEGNYRVEERAHFPEGEAIVLKNSRSSS